MPKNTGRTHFKTERPESCTASLNVRVPPSLLEKVKQKPQWQEYIRNLIAEDLNSDS